MRLPRSHVVHETSHCARVSLLHRVPSLLPGDRRQARHHRTSVASSSLHCEPVGIATGGPDKSIVDALVCVMAGEKVGEGVPQPLQVVELAWREAQVPQLGLGAHHHLLFTALYSGLDASLSAREAALLGGAATVCQRSVETALTYDESSLVTASAAKSATPSSSSSSADVSSFLFPPTRNQLAHVRLVKVFVRARQGPSCAANELAALSSALHGVSGELPDYVLSSLLAFPTHPILLTALVDWVVAGNGGCLDARLFSLVMNALLRNDNFFSTESFAGMDALVEGAVLSRLGAAETACLDGKLASRRTPADLDYVSVRWTPLMNKWARVYVRQGQGLALYRCFEKLMRVMPAAENKIPCSFYVRLMGGLLDAEVSDAAAPVLADGVRDNSREPNCATPAWESILNVASRALRLFGRGDSDMRAIWVVLLKAALTLSPPHDDWRRVLVAHRLRAAHAHGAPSSPDRGGFLQVIRLVSAALARQSGNADAAEETVELLCEFLREQDGVSFLWLTDGVGTVLEELWSSQGPPGRAAALSLLTTLEEALAVRGTTGVQLGANPVLARAMERFRMEQEDPPLFWWRCGCGAELPAAAKRCMVCLRWQPRASWVCPRCHEPQQAPCSTQACSCGCPNPRLTAAREANRDVCATCGTVLSAVGVPCARCAEVEAREKETVPCGCCGATHSANALYCPTCFAVPADRPPLALWRCEACAELNYSTWSSCRRCQAPRRVGCFRAPFVPWRCGCGTTNHPRSLACATCTVSAAGTGVDPPSRYTCRGCQTLVEVSGTEVGLGKAQLSLTRHLSSFLVHPCLTCGTLHPRDQLLLYSPALPRHCLRCAGAVNSPGAVSVHGGFYHCGLHHRINEHYPFLCPHCKHADELQTGYHCTHCLRPRPELQETDEKEPSLGAFFVWRCMHETNSVDAALCGAWNYSWASQCRSCQESRKDTVWECRARAYPWKCPACLHHNRPIDVAACAQCGRATQPIVECDVCGVPHLTYECQT